MHKYVYFSKNKISKGIKLIGISKRLSIILPSDYKFLLDHTLIIHTLYVTSFLMNPSGGKLNLLTWIKATKI